MFFIIFVENRKMFFTIFVENRKMFLTVFVENRKMLGLAKIFPLPHPRNPKKILPLRLHLPYTKLQ